MLKIAIAGLVLLGCGKKVDKEAPAPAADPKPTAAAPDALAAPAPVKPSWYLATMKAPDGLEAKFFIGLSTGPTPEAIYKVGRYELRNPLTFDGKKLSIPIPVHETTLEADVVEPGKLAGTFKISWRAWGAGSLPMTAVEVPEPALAALGTIAPNDQPPLDLAEAHTTWKLKMSEAGTVKMTLDQVEPGSFDAILMLDNGNLSYVAGNGRGDKLVLTGFDGTSPYRLEVTFDKARKQATGTFAQGHRFHFRETLTATRAPGFELAVKTKAIAPKDKIELPNAPEIYALPPGPLVVEVSGSWCAICRYAAPVLHELYREYHPRGVQMVTLLYEFSDDAAYDAERVAAFKKAYNPSWPVVAVTGKGEDLYDILPSNLKDVDPAGFPVTLFVRADRTLHSLHAGFASPDAKDEFARVSAIYKAGFEAIVSAPGAGSAASPK